MDNGFISEVHTVQSSKDPRSLAYFWMLHEKKRNFSAPRYCNLVIGDISLRIQQLIQQVKVASHFHLDSLVRCAC